MCLVHEPGRATGIVRGGHASGGAVAPGAMLDSGLVLPVATSLPIGPKGVYNSVGVLLPQVGSVTFTADATAEYAVAASAFDYMAGTICPLLGAGRCPPRLPSDLSGATSFLNDLVAKLVPIKLVGALQKIALSLGLVVDGSPSPSGFIAAVGDLAQEIQTSPEVVAYLTSKGFGITELNSFSEFAKYVTLPWKIIVTFWDIGRSLLAPTVSVITVVGR